MRQRGGFRDDVSRGPRGGAGARDDVSRGPRGGVRWLLAHQEVDGSWFGRWGANHVYGTGAAVPALVACGLPGSHDAVRAAVDWLLAHQNDDGGWGEDLRSYRDPAWVGRGASTASQTAWALLALLAAGERGHGVSRGVDWLLRSPNAADSHVVARSIWPSQQRPTFTASHSSLLTVPTLP